MDTILHVVLCTNTPAGLRKETEANHGGGFDEFGRIGSVD